MAIAVVADDGVAEDSRRPCTTGHGRLFVSIWRLWHIATVAFFLLVDDPLSHLLNCIF